MLCNDGNDTLKLLRTENETALSPATYACVQDVGVAGQVDPPLQSSAFASFRLLQRVAMSCCPSWIIAPANVMQHDKAAASKPLYMVRGLGTQVRLEPAGLMHMPYQGCNVRFSMPIQH